MKSFRSFLPCLAAFLLVSAALDAAAVQDWPGWRGPTRDGHAAAGQTPPVKWSETEKVVWRTAIRGRGHSSPTVVGNRSYLTTADTATEEPLVV